MQIETGTTLLLAAIDDGVATMTFNDPARHNVLSTDMRQAMLSLADAWDRDPAVRVIVMRGAGDRAFSTGADIGGLDARNGTAGHAIDDDRSRAAWMCWQAMSKPVIAMIDGYCIGGGLLMALHADIRICSDRSEFAIPAARLGLGYGTWGVRAVMQVAGPAVAADLLYSARRLTAHEAHVAGLVNRVVPSSRLGSVVSAAAAEIARNAPLTIGACKAAIRHELDPLDGGAATVENLVLACYASEDYREGRAAFEAKRDPVFRGE